MAKDLVEGSDRPVRDRKYDSRYQTQVAKSVETLKATEEPEMDIRLVKAKTSRRKRRVSESPVDKAKLIVLSELVSVFGHES